MRKTGSDKKITVTPQLSPLFNKPYSSILLASWVIQLQC